MMLADLGADVVRVRDEWAAVFAGTEACVTPVLSWTGPALLEDTSGPLGTPPRETTAIVDVGW